MKILAIRIKNLASLEGVSEIDFTKEPLSSAGIFAITGPTGAGKSTLLDALCLALYSKTPRYLQAREIGVEIEDVTGSKISQGDIRSILRDGTSEGYAEVDFIGIDGVPYRAKWTVRRARNKVDGTLQSDSIELINLSTNVVVPGRKTETLKEIERLVGLNFEQFTRSVLLAQGDFTAFLKADKDAKSSLLEKLTGTDIYSEISRHIFEKFKQVDNELENLNRQIEGIEILKEDELKLLNEQKVELNGKIAEFQKQIVALSNEINWHNSSIELAAGKVKAEEDLLKAKKEKDDATERINNFILIEGIQPVRSLIASKANAIDLLQQKTQALESLMLNIKGLNEKHESIVLKLATIDNTVLEKQNESSNAQPDIENAKRLDTLIKEKKEQAVVAEQESKTAIQNKQDHLLLIQQKETEINTQEAEIKQLENWKNENVSRQPIAENITLITSKLIDAGKLLNQQGPLIENIHAADIKIKKANSDIIESEKNIIEKENILTGLNSSFLAEDKELAMIQIDVLNEQKNALIPSIEGVVAAKGHWELLYAALKDQQVVTGKLDSAKQEFADKTEEIKRNITLFEEAVIKKQHTEKLFSQAKLQAAENIEDLRSLLIDGEECPVCGSKEHPFSMHNPQLDKVLEGLEKEYLDCSKTYDQLLGEISSLEKLCAKLEVDRKAFEKDIETNSGKILLLEKKWESAKIDKACFLLPHEERLTWLESQEKDLRAKLSDAQTKITSYNQRKGDLDIQKGQIDAINNELLMAINSVKDIEREQQSLNETVTRLNTELNKSNEDIAEITALLTPYFSKSTWVTGWKQDAQKFNQDITAFSENWNSKVGNIETGNNKLVILKTTLDGLQKQLTGFDTNVDQKGKKLSELQQNLLAITQQRGAIFYGEKIADVEQKLKKAIDDAIVSQKTIKGEKDQLNSKLTKAQANKIQLNQDKESFDIAAQKLTGQIEKWLSDYNSKHFIHINENDLARLLTHSNEWIESERTSLNLISEAITKAQATFDERSLQVINHKKKKTSTKSLEELMGLDATVKSDSEIAVNEKNEIEFKLRNDLENKKKVGKLLKEIESKNNDHENWGKLNDLLGSSDGKKFRQIAQEYTLDILLGFANIHLQGLTNRYKLLRVPGSLGLQVIDKDMGNEVRTVYSLSGGESFLVSLALALGLASLSSNKMQVESLFIDEGFGSLDPTTLSIAMDALERLHNQGRKVGVISHVQEMTERIPVQIKVTKQSSGKSKIEATNQN